MIEPAAPPGPRTRRIADLDQQQLMVCATGRESRSGPVEDPPNFLEPQQITIKTKRLLQIFHIEDDMAEVMCFHSGHSLLDDDCESSALIAPCANTTSGPRCSASWYCLPNPSPSSVGVRSVRADASRSTISVRDDASPSSTSSSSLTISWDSGRSQANHASPSTSCKHAPLDGIRP